MAKKSIRSNKQIGNQGEDLAETYLIEKGHEILRRNYYSQYGEIDIVTRKDDQIIFYEVKTRTNEKFGNPEDAIDQKKVECLISTAHCFLEDYSDEDQDWRLDLLSIKLLHDGLPEIIHFEDINE